MTRRLLMLAVFLLAGVVVNVGVAWEIAGLSTNYDTLRWQAFERLETKRLVWTFTGFGSELVVCDDFSDGGPDAIQRQISWHPYERAIPSRNDWSLLRTSDSLPNVRMEEACGWPRPALRWYQLRDGERTLCGGIDLGSARQYALENGGSAGYYSSFPGDRTLPLISIWPGFAVNTLFYAAVLWLLICGPFALRRLIRVRRGLCPACAYPRSESAVCSECGKALPQQAKAAT